MKLLVSTKDMDRNEWLKWRKKGIGGSDASAVAGISRWKSPLEVYLEKTDQIPSREAGEPAYWGTVLEDIVAKEFTKRTGLSVRKKNAMFQHDTHPFMFANIDREVMGSNKGLECKTASSWKESEWKNDDVPPEYVLQCQHYMEVMDWDSMYLAVLIGGQKFIWKEVPRDQELIDLLIYAERDFWDRVERKDPPPIEGHPKDKDLLDILYPSALRYDESVELPEEAELLVKEFEEAGIDEKDAKARKESAGNKLKSLLGENPLGRLDTHIVKWENVISSRLDSTRLKKEKPEVYFDYLKESAYRKFSIREVA